MRQKRQKQQKAIRVSIIFIVINQETKAVKKGELNSDIRIYLVYEYCKKKKGINAVN